MPTASATSPISGDSLGAVFYATVDVKTHVPITLDMQYPNFNKWKAFFRNMCGKFGLLDHIDGTVAAKPTDRAWKQADCCVKSWLFGSVADSVLDDLSMERDQTARALWLKIEALFEAIKGPRAIYLSYEFHFMIQGDLSITDYCQKMKTTADALRDVGHDVTESQLVHNILCGLNKRFSNTAYHIASTPALRTFAEARNALVLKELRLSSEGSSCGSSSCCSSSSNIRGTSQAKNNGGGGGKRKFYNNNKKKPSGGQGQQALQQAGHMGSPRPPANGPWFCFSPWAGQQQWRPLSQGFLGPYQAHTAFAPPFISTPPMGQQPLQQQANNWDLGGLIAALNQMTLHSPGVQPS